MATTDLAERINEAVVAIGTADSGLATLCGRSIGLVRPWMPGTLPTLPVLLYQVVVLTEIGGLGDSRRALVQLTALAEGDGAGATANAMIERCELAYTQPALAGQGLDAAPMRRNRPRVGIDPESTRALARSDLELELWVTK